MVYKVIFDHEARIEAIEAMEYIALDSPRNAVRWYAGMEKEIRNLKRFPKRWPLAPEGGNLGEELRQVIYRSYRIIYRVEERSRTVRIVHVRHTARRAIGEDEFQGED